MKVGDLVRVTSDIIPSNSAKYREMFPWKFELGVVTCVEPYGSFPGKEVYVHFPSYPEKTILCSNLEVVSVA